MSVRSSALDYMCHRLEGVSTGVFRLESQNQTSNITPQSIIRFTLPSNALVDMHSFAFHFNAQTSAGVLAGGQVRLPNKIESLLNRVEVSIGGVAVSSGANFYNTLCHALQVVDGWKNDAGQNHPEIITTGAGNNYVDGVSLVGAAQNAGEQPDQTANRAQFCISEWAGFLGECEPRVLDTALVGDIVVTLYLEQPQLCITQSDGVAAATFITSAALGAIPPISYTLNNVYASIRVYSLASGVYDNLVSEQISEAGSLEVGFKQYFSFRDTNTGSSRWTIASQSLDRVLVAHHYNANPNGVTQHPVLSAGYNPIASTAADRVLNLGKVKYIHPYSQFNVPLAAAGTQCLFEWQLNGAKYPQWRASPDDCYELMRLASNTEMNADGMLGRQQYLGDKFVTAIKLTLDAPNARFIQGLDTRSVSLNGYYYIYNQAVPDKVITLFAEVTSSLLISDGRQIELIQ